MIVMSRNYFWDFAKHALGNDILNEGLIEMEKLNEVINFHHSQVWLPTSKIFNNHQVSQGELWNEYYGENIENPFNTKIINLPDHDIVNQYIEGHYNEDITKIHLEAILKIALGDRVGKFKYHTIQKSPSVIPLILVFEKDFIYGVNAGSYLYNFEMHSLTQNANWEEEEITYRFREVTNDTTPLAKIAIAYAIDLRRSMVEYGKRGYRHSLIEVGTMVQCLKETIEVTNSDSSIQISSEIFTDFSDSSFTHLCGLNPRLSPIVLIQWLKSQ